MPGDRAVTLLALGDVMLTRPVAAVGGSRDPALQRAFAEADLVFANLEVPLTDRGEPADKAIAFRASPALAGELARAGFDVVSIANNHALDYGAEGLLQTLDVVRQAGVAIVGGGRTRDEALAPAVLEAQGLRVAFLGLACTLPPGYAASEHRAGIAPVRVITQFAVDAVSLDENPGISPYVRTWALEDDVERACAAVRAARAQADVVVVGIHWGIPHGWVARFQDPLAEYQRPLGRALIEAGAHAVVGHHPHVLHGLERWGDGWILYSTGNYLFHTLGAGAELKLSRTWPPYRLESLTLGEARDGAVFRLHLSAGGVTGVEVIPVRLDEQGEPRTLSGSEAAAVLGRVAAHSEALGLALAVDGDVARA